MPEIVPTPEEEAMQITVDKSVNIPTLITVATLLIGCGVGYVNIQRDIADVVRRTAELEISRKERVALADQKYSLIDSQGVRLGNVEGQVKAINERLDNSFNRLGERLDRMSEVTSNGFRDAATELATIKTSIAVLTQRVDTLGGGPEKRAELQDRITSVPLMPIIPSGVTTPRPR